MVCEPGALHGDKLAARVLPQEEPENQFVKIHDALLSMSLSSSLRLSGSAFAFRSHVLIWFKAGRHTVAKVTGGIKSVMMTAWARHHLYPGFSWVTNPVKGR